MRRGSVRIAGLAVLAWIFAGCFTVGRNFASTPVKQIEKGVTTKADVTKAFGDPFRKGLDDGYESWTYVYNRWSPFYQTRSKDLYVVFNNHGSSLHNLVPLAIRLLSVAESIRTDNRIVLNDTVFSHHYSFPHHAARVY